MIYLFFFISIILTFILSAVYFCRKNDTSLDFLSGFIRKQYLESRFKIWDDLASNEKTKKFNKKQKTSLIFLLKFHLHKIESTFFYFLAMFFKSSRDSFALLNCDRSEIYNDEDYEKHLAKKKRISALSISVLFLLIIANIATGLITSFVFPNIFKTQAAGLTQTSQADFQAGTADANIDLTTSPGDIKNVFYEGVTKYWGDNGASPDSVFLNYVSDGAGNFITVRSSGTSLYAQKIDSDGNLIWGAEEKLISSSYAQAFYIISDGSNGAIVVWTANTFGSYDVYAQRIDSSGNFLWGASGVAVSQEAGNQSFAKFIADGSGGAIIAWADNRTGAAGIYAQKINSAGAIQWDVNGKKVSDASATSTPVYLAVTSDGSGGMVFVWNDGRNGTGFYDTFSQKIDSSGNRAWANDANVVVGTWNKNSFAITTDDAGGVIISWADQRVDGTAGIYVQRIESDGSESWASNGINISGSDGTKVLGGYGLSDYNNIGSAMTSDGAGGAIISWTDYREVTSMKIYAQRVNSLGATQWTENGVRIDNTSSKQIVGLIVKDGEGNYVFSWSDNRDNPSGNPTSVYTQKINGNGETIFGSAILIKTLSYSTSLVSNAFSKTGVDYFLNITQDSHRYSQRFIFSEGYLTPAVFTSSNINAGSSVNWSTLSSEKNLPAGSSISFETRTGEVTPSVENFSLGATASSSSENGGYLASEAIDGTELDVPPSNNSAWMPSGGLPQWLEIDYGEEKIISEARVHFYTFGGTDYIASDFQIQTWNGSTWDDQETITGNADVNVSYTFSAPVTTQKIRIYATATPSVVIVSEFETYGSSLSWSAWEAVTDGVISSPDAQYIQYRVTLSTTDTSVTPTLSSVTLDYVSDAVPPTNDTQSPLSGATDIATSTTITALFSEPMATSTVSTTTFTLLKNGTDPVSGTVGYSGLTATFTPDDDLDFNSIYVATITTGAEDLAGNGLAVNSSWSFTTASRPTVTAVSPTNNNQHANISSPIIITFSKDMATSSINSSTFSAAHSNGSVTGSISYANRQATLTPTRDLDCSREYTITLTTGVMDAANNGLASNYTSTFTTSCSSIGSIPSPVITTNTDTDTTTTTSTNSNQSNTSTETTTTVTNSTDNPVTTNPETPASMPEQTNNTDTNTNTNPATQPTTGDQTTSSGSNNPGGQGGIVETGTGEVENGNENEGLVISDQGLGTTTELPGSIINNLGEEFKSVVNNIEETPTGALIDKAYQAIQQVKTALAESTTATAASTAISAGVVALTVIQFAGQVNSASQIPYVFFNLFGFLAYRRKRHAGIVYDAKTGQPVPFAKVTISDKATGAAKETKVTDKYGSYFFLVPKGSYTLLAQKKGYEQMTEKQTEQANTQYVSPYTKGKVLEFEKDGLVNVSIPIQKIQESNWEHFFSHPWTANALTAIFVVAFTFSVIMAVVKPNIFNLTIASLYVMLGVLKLVNLAVPQWGLTLGQKGHAEPFTLVEVVDTQTKKFLGRTIADEHGRYAFILDKGKYSLNARTTLGKIAREKLEVASKRRVIGKNIKI